MGRLGPSDSGSGLGRLAGYDTGSGLGRLGPSDSGSGLGRLAGYDTGSGLGRLAPSDSGSGLGRLAGYDTGSGLGRLAPSDSGSGLGRLAPSDTGSGLERLAPPDADAGPTGVGPADAGGGRGRRRAGATRADLLRSDDGSEQPPSGRRRAHPDTAGATALMPRIDPVEAPAPDPDEVTDTGARRARSAFRVAEEPADDRYDEPSLVLQWGIFIVQTLTGAAVGLGVWLGFFRLWSTWPFYAAPAVGAAMILMLVVARALRRRSGHELDLLTAVVTVGVGTVLAVLPAAFTLQGLG